jgi:hypothetical protein
VVAVTYRASPEGRNLGTGNVQLREELTDLTKSAKLFDGKPGLLRQ